MSKAGGDFARAMRFAIWAEQLRTPPRVEDVMTRFDVSRATAYRLIGCWLDAKGRPRSDRPMHSPEASEKRSASLRRYHASRAA